MKLVAKGNNEYVGMTRVPAEAATAASKVILASLRAAVEGLAAVVATDNKSDVAYQGALANFAALRKLWSDINGEMKDIDSILGLVEMKIRQLGAP